MTHFLVHFAGIGDGLGDLGADSVAIPVPHSVHAHRDRGHGHCQFAGHFSVITFDGSIAQETLQALELSGFAGGDVFPVQTGERSPKDAPSN